MSKQIITVIKGDGIGPSIVEAAIQVLDKVGCEFEYEYVDAGLTALEKTGELLPQATLDAIARNKITLKGPLTTPVGEGFTSINVTLRKKFNLYSNVRPVISFKGTKARYDNIDIITVRENTEGMYSGAGQVVKNDGELAEAMSIVTREGSARIVEFAFEQATPLLIFVAALAAGAVTPVRTTIDESSATDTLRNMKTSIRYLAMVPREI